MQIALMGFAPSHAIRNTLGAPSDVIERSRGCLGCNGASQTLQGSRLGVPTCSAKSFFAGSFRSARAPAGHSDPCIFLDLINLALLHSITHRSTSNRCR